MKRNTQQKELITRIVLDACNHPTAEMVYDMASVEMPTISLGTVYRVLKDLAKEGTIKEVSVPSAPSRFDCTTKPHAHFVCKECGEVEDAYFNDELTSIVTLKGKHKVNSVNVLIEGVCEKCKMRQGV